VNVTAVVILVCAVGLALVLILGGLAAIAFGLSGLLFGSAALLPIALVGLITFGSGLLFALKIALPALRLAKED
jgi:hypothetical protein